MRSILALAFLTLIPLFWPATSSAEILDRRQVGDWTLLLAADDNGALCNASRADDQGRVFSIAAERGNHAWFFVLTGDDLRLEPWSEFEVTYVVDGLSITRKALATSASSVTVVLGGTFASTDPLRHGSRIQIRANNRTFTISLAGSARALDGVLDCANRHLGFAEAKSPADPFVPSKREPLPPVEGNENAQAAGGPANPFVPAKPDSQSLAAGDAAAAGSSTTPSLPDSGDRNIAGWTLMGPSGLPDDQGTCMVTRADVEGPILGITVQRPINIWFFTLAYQDWQFERGAYYPIDYAIDDAAPVSTVAQAKSATMIVIPLGKTHAATEPFRHGSTLDFRMPKTIALFDLSGSTQALDALIECAHQRLGL